MRRFLTLLVLISASVPRDQFEGQTNAFYKSHTFESKAGRQLQTSSFQPLRIVPHFILDHATNPELSEDAMNHLRHKLVPNATRFWMDALRVQQLTRPLVIDGYCTERFPIPHNKTCKYQISSYSRCALVNPLPAQHLIRTCSSCSGGDCTGCSGGEGVNGDYLLYVTADHSTVCQQNPNVLAYAGKCFTDQWDRPIVGYTNFCPRYISTKEADFSGQLTTAVHEMAHSLGFARENIAYFRYADGTPRTPRKASGTPDRPHVDGQPSVYIPANNTLVFTNRSSRTTPVGELNPPSRTTRLVTPEVQRVVRAMFDCPTLNGAELEDSDGEIGSHWEERIFNTEAMSPIAHSELVVSSLTLAYFQDSGWYKANYSAAHTPVWGYKKGCAWAEGPCVVEGVAQSPFCHEQAARGCTADSRYKGACNMYSHTDPVPFAFRYFDPTEVVANTKLGGSKAMDYCPYVQRFGRGDCTDPSNAPKRNYQGESFGPHSRCIISSLRQTVDGYQLSSAPTIGCYEVKCDYTGISKSAHGIPMIKLTLRASAVSLEEKEEWVRCEPTVAGSQTEKKTVAGFIGKLTCPEDSALLCPPRDDAGLQFPSQVLAEGSFTLPTPAPVPTLSGKWMIDSNTGLLIYKPSKIVQRMHRLSPSSGGGKVKPRTGPYQDGLLWLSYVMVTVAVLALLSLTVYLIAHCSMQRCRRHPLCQRKAAKGFMLLCWVITLGLCLGALFVEAHFHSGVNRLGDVKDDILSFMRESEVQLDSLLLLGETYLGNASAAACMDPMLMSEIVSKGDTLLSSAQDQTTTIKGFGTEIEKQSGQYYGDDQQNKYKSYISYIVRALMGVTMVVCVTGLLGLTTKNVMLHSITILLSILAMILACIPATFSLPAAVVFADFCYEGPQNATVRIASEEPTFATVMASNTALLEYYVRCSGTNPLDNYFAAAVNSALTVRNATAAMMALKLTELDDVMSDDKLKELLSKLMEKNSTWDGSLDIPETANYTGVTSNKTLCNNTALQNMQDLLDQALFLLEDVHQSVSCKTMHSHFVSITYDTLCVDVIQGLYSLWIVETTTFFALFFTTVLFINVRQRIEHDPIDEDTRQTIHMRPVHHHHGRQRQRKGHHQQQHHPQQHPPEQHQHQHQHQQHQHHHGHQHQHEGHKVSHRAAEEEGVSVHTHKVLI